MLWQDKEGQFQAAETGVSITRLGTPFECNVSVEAGHVYLFKFQQSQTGGFVQSSGRIVVWYDGELLLNETWSVSDVAQGSKVDSTTVGVGYYFELGATVPGNVTVLIYLGWLSQGGWELHAYKDLTIFDEMTRVDFKITFIASTLALYIGLPMWLFAVERQTRRKVKNADWIAPVVWGGIMLIAVYYMETATFQWMVGVIAALLVVYGWRLRRVHKGLISIPERQYGPESEALYALLLMGEGVLVSIAALPFSFESLFPYTTQMALIIPLYMWIGVLGSVVPFAIIWFRNWKKHRH